MTKQKIKLTIRILSENYKNVKKGDIINHIEGILYSYHDSLRKTTKNFSSNFSNVSIRYCDTKTKVLYDHFNTLVEYTIVLDINKTIVTNSVLDKFLSKFKIFTNKYVYISKKFMDDYNYNLIKIIETEYKKSDSVGKRMESTIKSKLMR